MLSASTALQCSSNTMVNGLANGSDVGHVHSASSDTLSPQDIKRQFEAAVNVIRNLPSTPSKDAPFQPSDTLKLRFYAFYKQATEGPNKTSKPAFYDIVGKYKWQAWSDLGHMSKVDAMQGYVNELKRIVETMALTQPVADFYEVLGPFYEFVSPDVKSDSCSRPVDSLSSTSSVTGKVSSVSQGSARMSVTQSSGSSVHKKQQQQSDAMRAPGKVNGYVNGDTNELELSDNEEFSDSYDNLTSDCVDQSTSNQVKCDEIISARGETHLNPPRFSGNCVTNRPASSAEPNSQGTRDQAPSSGTSSAGSTGGGNGHSASRVIPEVNEQIAIAILRLQQSMEQVCNRLDSLETQIRMNVSSNDRSSLAQSRPKSGKASWWPLQEMSTSSAVFLILWPLLAHYLMERMKSRMAKN